MKFSFRKKKKKFLRRPTQLKAHLPQPTNLISVYRSWNKAQTAQQPVQGRVSFADAISIGCEQSKQGLINKKLNPYLSSFHLNVVGMTHITGLRRISLMSKMLQNLLWVLQKSNWFRWNSAFLGLVMIMLTFSKFWWNVKPYLVNQLWSNREQNISAR